LDAELALHAKTRLVVEVGRSLEEQRKNVSHVQLFPSENNHSTLSSTYVIVLLRRTVQLQKLQRQIVECYEKYQSSEYGEVSNCEDVADVEASVLQLCVLPSETVNSLHPYVVNCYSICCLCKIFTILDEPMPVGMGMMILPNGQESEKWRGAAMDLIRRTEERVPEAEARLGVSGRSPLLLSILCPINGLILFASLAVNHLFRPSVPLITIALFHVVTSPCALAA